MNKQGKTSCVQLLVRLKDIIKQLEKQTTTPNKTNIFITSYDIETEKQIGSLYQHDLSLVFWFKTFYQHRVK